MKAFEIILNSQSHTGYDIPDVEFKGFFTGLVGGWQWEYVDKDGNYEYSSVSYFYGTPEAYADKWNDVDGTPWIHSTPKYKGYEPTGRVVFRGYAEEYYDSDEHEWFVRTVEI